MAMIPRVKGTQDSLDCSVINYFLEHTKKFLEASAFSEVATPLLEHAELFLRTLGQETDVVSKQMYMVKAGEDERICLRPEGTASVMRAYLEAHTGLQATAKFFTYGPMFRYERPQKGRYRQFSQLSMELINARSILYDAYFIGLLAQLFKKILQIPDFTLLLNFLGCAADRVSFKAVLREFLVGKELCATCAVRKEKNILRIFDCKNGQCQSYYAQAPLLTNSLCQHCLAEWQELQSLLSAQGVSFTQVPTLVRGLDYYNKTVFEFTSNHLGSQDAFCSGGRYDGLAQELGSKTEVPSLGAAIGVERMCMILETLSAGTSFAKQVNRYLFVPLDAEYAPLVFSFGQKLQDAGLTVDYLFDGDSIKTKMRRANALNATYTLLLGSHEYEQRVFIVKSMATGAEERVPFDQLIERLRALCI
jgi:histidyl-tRNA synthetase